MSSIPRYPTILFDLDGTLTDPFEGIARSVRYALERLNGSQISDEVLRRWIGPSLRGSFASAFDGDAAMVAQAIALYAERMVRIGIYENKIYPGIPALLTDLAAAGCCVCLATAKPQSIGQRILDHFEIASHFTFIGGASFDTSRESKAAVIAYVLGELPAAARAGAVMVGDREHDVIGASENGLLSIGVSYGYGTREELAAAGAGAIADHVGALRDLLL